CSRPARGCCWWLPGSGSWWVVPAATQRCPVRTPRARVDHRIVDASPHGLRDEASTILCGLLAASADGEDAGGGDDAEYEHGCCERVHRGAAVLRFVVCVGV